MNEVVTAAIGDEIITIDQVIHSTKQALRLMAITDYDSQIETYINEGAGKIDSKSTSIQKPVLLEVCDGNRVKLPKGYKNWLAVRLVPDSTLPSVQAAADFTTLTVNASYDLLYLNKDYLNSCGLTGINNPMLPLSNTFQIVQGYIILTFPLPDGVNHVLLGYEGWNVDSNGLMYLAAKMEVGLRAYACAMMLTIYPEIWNKEYMNFYGQTVERWDRSWRLEFSKIIGDDAVKQFISSRYAIKRVFGALLWDQNK